MMLRAGRGIALCSCAFALFAAFGCRAGSKKVIGVVPKGTAYLFFVSVHAGAVAAGQDFGVEILWNGPQNETEYDRQIQIIDSLIARRVDGLAVAAAERKALVAPIDRAVRKNIPVAVFDSGIDSANYTTFVATNNYEAGQTAARTLAGLLGGKGKVGVVMHAPGSYSTVDRERGFDEVMLKEFPRIRVVGRQFGMSDRARSMAAAENILTANPDLDGIFASTEPSSAGVSLALKGRGLSGKVKFVGFDSSDAMIEDLKAGTLDATLVQDPFRIGYEAVKAVVEKLNGAVPPKRIDLSARVVTRPDLDKPEVQRLLFPDIRKYLGK